MSSPTLSFRHALLALAVMAVWGTNFVVIRLGLDHLPPLLFAALRDEALPPDQKRAQATMGEWAA